MHRIYVRQSIEAGLKDIEDGRTIDVEELRAKYGLKDLRVRWTRRAENHLQGIHDYMARDSR